MIPPPEVPAKSTKTSVLVPHESAYYMTHALEREGTLCILSGSRVTRRAFQIEASLLDQTSVNGHMSTISSHKRSVPENLRVRPYFFEAGYECSPTTRCRVIENGMHTHHMANTAKLQLISFGT